MAERESGRDAYYERDHRISLLLSKANASLPDQRGPLWVNFLLLSGILGTVLLGYYSRRFVFFYAELYTPVGLWAVALFTPLMIYWLASEPAVKRRLSVKYPNAGMRNIVVLPVIASCIVVLGVCAPLGGLFAGAALLAGPIEHVRSTAIEVGTHYPGRRGCDQRATLRFESIDKQICLDDLYSPGAMSFGQVVDVGTAQFTFGFLIVSVKDAVPPATSMNSASEK